MIGIMLADRTFFPIADEGVVAHKRVVLTTARAGQQRAELALYRGSRPGIPPRAEDHLGTISFRELHPDREQGSELDLELKLDGSGALRATAVERGTGNMRSLSVDAYRPPPALHDPALYAEREQPTETRPSRNTAVRFGVAIALLLMLLAAFGVGWWYWLRDAGTPAGGTAAAEAMPEPAVVQGAPPADVSAAAAVPHADRRAAELAATELAATELAATEGATTVGTEVELAESISIVRRGGYLYRIVWGDTLWAISRETYGTPWLYPELARRNRIVNPDRIYAGNTLALPELEILRAE